MNTESLGQSIGLPTFDRRTKGRIWAFKKNNSSVWEACYSDDYGDSWIYWATPNPEPTGQRGPYIHKDNNGNIYYQSGTDRKRTFHRIDGVTKTTSKVIDFYYPSGGIIDVYPWNFTEDNDGYIFVSQYYLSSNGGHMLFRSTPENRGTQFESLDILIRDFPDARHFHGTYANPFNGKLYIQIGDFQAKRFLVSDDKLETYRIIGGVTGHTGLTFTKEAIYTSEDLPGDNNYVWRTTDDSTYERIWTPPSDLIKTPMYYLHAVGDNELWISFVDDNKSVNLSSAIVRMTKAPGLNSNWTYDIIDKFAGSEFDNSNWYAMASDGQGVIPEISPYVFMERCWWDAAISKPTVQGIYRIKRDTAIKKTVIKKGYFVVNDNGTIRKGSLVNNLNGSLVKQSEMIVQQQEASYD